jgi:mycofactocin biosynthesis protein MftB
VTLTTTDTFDASAPWCLTEQVSLRDEEFGALAYHHVSRRLVFLKSRRLVEVVGALAAYPSVDEALNDLVPSAERARYRAALASLAASGIIRGR